MSQTPANAGPAGRLRLRIYLPVRYDTGTDKPRVFRHTMLTSIATRDRINERIELFTQLNPELMKLCEVSIEVPANV